MLFKNAIDEKTYILLENLMQDEKLNDFYLVGGTAIALKIGHRKSIDIDLFTKKDFDSEELRLYLNNKYKFELSFQEKNTLKGFINDVLVDFIKYDYKNIKSIKFDEGIRMLSLEDIIAMKLVAIYQDGSRMKDFIDIAYLSNYYTLNDMIGFCKEKTEIDNTFSILKGLTYFNSIDFTDNVLVLDEKYSFDKVKKHLLNMVDNPDKKLKFGK